VIYTGTWDGKVLKVVNGQIDKEIRLVDGKSQTCGTYDGEAICGRPLGIRRLNAQLLIVADAYYGIFTIDFEKGSIFHLKFLSHLYSIYRYVSKSI
jgi:hypothetical protein